MGGEGGLGWWCKGGLTLCLGSEKVTENDCSKCFLRAFSPVTFVHKSELWLLVLNVKCARNGGKQRHFPPPNAATEVI